MKKSSSTKEKPEAPEFICHLCNVTCMSALNLQTHFLGIKHRKVEVALRTFNTEKDEKIRLEPDATLQEHMDACKDSEPAVGLEYIYQYQQKKNFYECRVCECSAGLTHMFMHIIGAKHRLTYLFKHHPLLSNSFAPYVPSGPKKLKKLKDLCLKVEKEFGRQKINVIDALETQWHISTGSSTVNYDPDNELNQMDFTSDDVFGTSSKPKEHIITFLELKAAHEADKRAASSSDSIASTTEESEKVIPIQDTEQEIQKDADDESIKETCEKDVSSEEPPEADEDFTSNKDLFDFLEYFRILGMDDAKFVSRVVVILSTALRVSREKILHQYRQHQRSDQTTADPKDQHQRSDRTTADPKDQHQRSDRTTADPKDQHQRSDRTTADPKDQHQRSDRTTADPKDQQETSIEDIESQHCVSTCDDPEEQPETPTQDLAPSVVPSKEEPKLQSKKPLFPIPQPIPIDPLSQRKKLAFTLSTNKAQESGIPCNNESTTKFDPTKNIFQNADPNAQVKALWLPTSCAPSGAPLPPKAAPPFFPIEKGDVVQTFFESIKNMEVSEVASTLTKITASNPAFKGIHVPSLVHYLMETGKLKSAQSMQQQKQ